jgi:GABA(A) receptor-associated protein
MMKSVMDSSTTITVPKYREENPFDKRLSESQRIIDKYPDRRPIIIECNDNEIRIDKKKYLVPQDLTLSQFLYVIRKRMKLSADKALFMFLDNNTIPTSSSHISNLYEKHKDPDGFLYIYVSKEHVFG